jgi:hypothetical protein
MRNTSRKLGIKMGELPKRPIQINEEDIDKMFGGCVKGERCITDCDCCLGYKCYSGTLYDTKEDTKMCLSGL